jgi:exodeoxyribonuclease VII large subunit
LIAAAQQGISLKKDRLKRVNDHLQSINPRQLLKKGYSILFSENDRSIILSAKNISPRQSIRALLSDGEFIATVDYIQ